MFNYTEDKTFIHATDYRNAYNQRLIFIYDGAKRVGEIQENRDLSGAYVPCDHWRKETPIAVYYYEEKDQTSNVGYARTVAEAKKIFSDWYAKNREKCYTRQADVKFLPANPENEFYPTPSVLAGQMAALVRWEKVQTILEPSAGKGDLIEQAAKCWENRAWKGWSRSRSAEEIKSRVDCIEIDENLRHILTGKGYRVVHDDFLTYDTQKHYDLILMNPPFFNGDEHLLKALSMQRDRGGQIVCLLNAETVRNLCTNRRKILADALAEYGATIRFVSGAFARAQRKSDVEVAIVSVILPAAQRPSFIFDGLKRAAEQQAKEKAENDPQALVAGDWIDAMVASFQLEAKAGVALMEEYNALAPYIMNGTCEYSKPIIQLSIGGRETEHAGSDEVNSYLKSLRYKYWSSMMQRKELTSRMTSAMQHEYDEKVRELQDYDFSRCNVKRVIAEISAQLCQGVEASIMKLFEQLSAKHSWFPECEKNIHYYNGWATNKAHKVNSKVILPLNGFYAHWDGKKKLEAHEFAHTICDIERALSYLDGEGAISRIDPYSVAQMAETCQRTTVSFSYFDATFYKKGTCHIKFHEDAQILVDRLNIYAARSRAWLPPSYGKKKYTDMDAEERAVIDDFQGQDAYEAVVRDPSHYIVAPAQCVPLLSATA